MGDVMLTPLVHRLLLYSRSKDKAKIDGSLERKKCSEVIPGNHTRFTSSGKLGWPWAGRLRRKKASPAIVRVRIKKFGNNGISMEFMDPARR
ncbi:hypothetical protein PoB_000084900 [Plakobranchus ocellatus]|uniref:Uncharacterized protein n=1 Tax=Plakobranchus ocellatus TaxID=259542 RepID=A0AAV3XWQ2_9GAST|nr:hypothetical protein PoB_000084900 [Plakobranchus ocellatus]